MDVAQRGIITLICSSLTGEALTLPEGFDLEKAYAKILRHGILAMAYDGAVNCGIDKKLPVMQKMFQGYLKCMLQSEKQLQMVKKVCTAFDRAEVDYMLLKGCNMKDLYPKPELRQMGDADILIRTAQYKQIMVILSELGFEEQRESDHELIWTCPALFLELHKRLIPSDNEDYCRYFGDGWQLAGSSRGSRYEMDKEDEYIYLFTHLAKHYRDGGVGCRHVADLWVFRRQYTQVDWSYIENELDKLHLLEFERNMIRVLSAWFEGAEVDEKTQFITETIFQSGAWGKHSDHILATTLKLSKKTKSMFSARMKRMWNLAFIPYYQMKKKYPVLDRIPILLPVYWIVRIIDILFLTSGKWERHSQEFLHSTDENVKEYQRALQYVGLDFHFKE